MRFLIAPDKFKGSLTALEAAEAMSRGVLRIFPEATVVKIPIADGGEGTSEAICSALDGKWIAVAAHDPFGRDVEARYAWLKDGTAVIDMSEASGLWRIGKTERNPMRASTFGTGQLMADAIQRGAKKLLIGLGGSATKDGGIGMAAALGYQFLDVKGHALKPVPANLKKIARIVRPEKPIVVEIVALSDVQNPLTGERGSARVFGPQKGADPQMVEELDASLAHLAEVVARDLGVDHCHTPGAGAAGGLGFGLLSFCNAKICSGFETLAAILHLEEQIAASDIVLTGEGKLDAQTLEGKGPAGVAALACKHGKRVFAFAGAVVNHPRLHELFEKTYAITPPTMPLSEAMRKAAGLLEECVVKAALLFSKPKA